MTQHGALSIIEDIRPGMKDAVLRLLQRIDTDGAAANSLIPFGQMTSIHFARFVVLPERADAKGNPLPPGISFTTNYDQPLNRHLQELVQYGGQGLWQVFSLCNGFPEGAYAPQTLLQWLQAHNRKAETFYVGVGNRSVMQIRNENLLRKEIEDFVDSRQASLASRDGLTTRAEIVDYIMGKPGFEWARNPEPEPSAAWNLQHYGRLVLAALLLVLLLPLIIPFVIIWMCIMRYKEIGDKPLKNIVTKEHLRALTDRETGMVQAQFSALGNLKPGWFRFATMNFLLRLTDFLAPYLFSQGKLSGIPTVHFARWLLINDGRQMLFLSNYDGNSETYLRDFIHIAAGQLTLLFSHTMGYPKTKFMYFEGAKDAKTFMEWARGHQVITQVWYTANKDVTVKNIYNNSRIRKGLYGTMNEQEALKWLSLI